MGGGRKGRGRGNSRAMTREFPSLACLPRARPFFLAPITSKLLLRRPREFPPSAMLFSSLLLLVSIFSGMHQSSWKKGSTFTFQSKQTDAGEKLHTLFQAAAMSRKNKLSNVQKWWTKAHLHALCKQLCGNLLFAVLFYPTGSQRLIHRRELEDLYGKVRLWMKL